MNCNSILLIDDNDDSSTLVKFAVEQNSDWQVLTASTGKEGIAKAKLEQPDLILLDIMMPDLNGLDVYKLLKSDLCTRTIPIIFVTAVTPIASILKSNIPEDVEIIIKPFDIIKLADKVTKLCDRDRFY